MHEVFRLSSFRMPIQLVTLLRLLVTLLRLLMPYIKVRSTSSEKALLTYYLSKTSPKHWKMTAYIFVNIHVTN